MSKKYLPLLPNYNNKRIRLKGNKPKSNNLIHTSKHYKMISNNWKEVENIKIRK